LTSDLLEHKTKVSDLNATLEQERIAHRVELDAQRAQCDTAVSSCVEEFIKMLLERSQGHFLEIEKVVKCEVVDYELGESNGTSDTIAP
jgi:hypothetical protein